MLSDEEERGSATILAIDFLYDIMFILRDRRKDDDLGTETAAKLWLS